MIFSRQKQPIIYFHLLTALSLGSCIKPPCKCDFVPQQYIDLKIVNQQGQNLVYGSNAVYSFDSIQVLKNYNDFSIHTASVNRFFRDSSILRFDFYIPESRSFIYYTRHTKPDTLDVEWSEKKGKCCGETSTYYAPDQIKFNGALIQPINKIYNFLK